MSGLVGADVEQLVALAVTFERRSQALREVAASSSLALTVAAWTGGDVDRLRSEWNRVSKPAILNLSRELEQVGRDLRGQAVQQRETSTTLAGSRQSSAGHGDRSTRDHWNTLRDTDVDGIRIQGMRGDDGVVRYVVYLAGTDDKKLVGDRAILENRVQRGEMTLTYLKTIARMEQEIPKGAEVMIMGYSQGGIHAQKIAESGQFHVTDVVTFGSPFYANDESTHGANIVRIRDSGDVIPRLDMGRSAIDGALQGVDNMITGARSFLDPDGALRHVQEDMAGEARRLDVPTHAVGVKTEPMVGTHGQRDTYAQGADQYEEHASGSAEGRAILASQARYNGSIVSDTGK